MSMYEFDEDILQDFLTESGELLEKLESDLVFLETTPKDPELLAQIFRAIHTIKGSASFLALTNLVNIAHVTESALNEARNGTFVISKPEMDLLLNVVDILKVQFDEIRAGSEDLTPAPAELIAKLTSLAHNEPITETTSEPQAAVEDPFANQPMIIHDDGRTEQSIELDAGKLDLIEHMAADIKHTLELAKTRITELGSSELRQVACNNLQELFEDILKTVEFFEIEPVIELARVLDQSIDAIPSMSEHRVTQLSPRLLAVCELLDAQTAALTTNKLITWPIETLVDRVNLIKDSIDLTEGILAENATAQDALDADHICIGFELDTPEPQPQPLATTTETKPASIEDSGVLPSETQGATRAGVNIAEQTIRVEVSRLESLMNLVGELVLQKNRISALAEDIGRSQIDPELIEQMQATARTLDRVTSDIQPAVMRTRMQPLDKLFGKYPRLIRDLASKTNKEIELEINGGDTEVDKSVIEELGDPLVHLLRNSVDHGIELPDQREANGKPRAGSIQINAMHEGSHVSVQIIDTGKGLDREAIGAKAVERGLTNQDQLSAMSDEEVFRFILEPGFSTATEVSDLSGRGVGMDVVRTNIESTLKGEISLESEPGQGTTITITIPLTIAIMPAMMVAVADETFAIPLMNITEIVSPDPEMISSIGDKPVIRLRESVYPLISAQETFEIPEENRVDEPFVVVIGFNQKIIGLRVSKVIGQQEVVIKPLSGVKRSGPISGATVRNDGGVSLIMDIAELIRTTKSHQSTQLTTSPTHT